MKRACHQHPGLLRARIRQFQRVARVLGRIARAALQQDPILGDAVGGKDLLRNGGLGDKRTRDIPEPAAAPRKYEPRLRVLVFAT